MVVMCGILGLVTQSLPRRRLLYLVAGIVISLVGEYNVRLSKNNCQIGIIYKCILF